MRLRVELIWDARQLASLEAEELGEQVTDGPKMIFGKRIKIKSRRFGLQSYKTIIISKLGFYFEEDT